MNFLNLINFNKSCKSCKSCNNTSSTKDPVASEFSSPNDTPDKLHPISIVQSFGPKQHNEPKKINLLNLKRIGRLPHITLSKSPKYTASRYSEREKKINNSPYLELIDNLPLTDLPKRPRCTADRNGGVEKRINNNYKPSAVGSESRSLTNCPEQRQISTITIEPIPTTITKSNPVFPGLVCKLNLPLIESPKSIDNIERKDQHNTLKTPFWQSRLSHPTRHRTNSQARIKRSVNETYQRMKTTTNEWERYLRYVSQKNNIDHCCTSMYTNSRPTPIIREQNRIPVQITPRIDQFLGGQSRSLAPLDQSHVPTTCLVKI